MGSRLQTLGEQVLPPLGGDMLWCRIRQECEDTNVTVGLLIFRTRNCTGFNNSFRFGPSVKGLGISHGWGRQALLLEFLLHFV